MSPQICPLCGYRCRRFERGKRSAAPDLTDTAAVSAIFADCLAGRSTAAEATGRLAALEIGAWASRQSEPLGHRLHLWFGGARFTVIWSTGRLSWPTFWSGFRIVPAEIRFEEQDGR